jgi:hypothetical protein
MKYAVLGSGSSAANHKRNLVALSIWLGFSMAALFLYPLAVALDSSPYYLQWQPRHTAEAFAAVALLAPVLALGVFATWNRTTRLGHLALFGVAFLPMLSLAAGVSRQLTFQTWLIQVWESSPAGLWASGIVLLGLSVLLVRCYESAGSWLRWLLLAISPASFLVVKGLLLALAFPLLPLDIDRAVAATEINPRCSSVVALLFDELSFAYLYDEAGVRGEFPSIARVARGATNYWKASAPADSTLTSLPGFLAARRMEKIEVDQFDMKELSSVRGPVRFSAVERDGLFATARRVGLSPEMAGYYLPYCDLLGETVDVCRSFSFYNTATVEPGFSALHPLKTTLIMWPRQFPLGLFKNPPFARHQRRLVERSTAFALRAIDPSRPVFRLVHFSIPHLPFAFSQDGFDPPFDPLRQVPDTAYVRQLSYVDQLVGRVVREMEQANTLDRSTLVVLSDHGFRLSPRERDPLHIPFIVKHAGQRERVDITEPAQGEKLLVGLLGSACS